MVHRLTNRLLTQCTSLDGQENDPEVMSVKTSLPLVSLSLLRIERGARSVRKNMLHYVFIGEQNENTRRTMTAQY